MPPRQGCPTQNSAVEWRSGTIEDLGMRSLPDRVPGETAAALSMASKKRNAARAYQAFRQATDFNPREHPGV